MRGRYIVMGRSAIRIAIRLIIVLLMAGSFQPASAAPLPGPVSAASVPGPKNIIVMIGDGMGYNHSLAASYYRFGLPEKQVYYSFPVKYAMSTYPADGWGYDGSQAGNKFDYVKSKTTESSAAATAMATGVKTNDGMVGVDPTGKALVNWFQAAETADKATGVVTTVELSDATPAGFVAHNISRDDIESIAQEMILQSGTDVIMGAGNPDYDDNAEQLDVKSNTHHWVGGAATWTMLQTGMVQYDVDGDGVAETTKLIQSRPEFQALMTDPNPPERLVGVIHAYSASQQNRCRDLKGNPISITPTTPCPSQYLLAAPSAVPLNTGVPTLTEEALGAINVLQKDPDGFALMIEGGAIDHAAVANQPGRLIEEQIDFDQAVEAVVNWVDTHSNWNETLLIVTADHEAGYLWGPNSDGSNGNKWQPLINNGIGKVPGMQFYETGHTNSLVRLYAKGAYASYFDTMVADTDPMRGPYIDNTGIAEVMFQILPHWNYIPQVFMRP